MRYETSAAFRRALSVGMNELFAFFWRICP
jgi:hypothetical protein